MYFWHFSCVTTAFIQFYVLYLFNFLCDHFFAAYFNPSDCSKLLTTDQHDQIRVYASCDWTKPQQIIRHPHRQFQHLTPIKVCLISSCLLIILQ